MFNTVLDTEYEDALTIFTDGSKSDVGTGAAIFVPLLHREIQYKLPDNASVFTKECYALPKSRELSQILTHQSIVVCSDSLAALSLLVSCIQALLMAALPEPQPEDLNNLVCEARNTVIVTGFGPFENHNINASWEAVRLLPSTGIASDLEICLITEQIPVSYDDVGTKIPKLWDKYKPLLVVHVGVSNMARKITLEQAAQKSGYDRLDIFGQTPACNECCVGSTPLIQSGLDINQLSNMINSTSETVQTCLSDNAGRYLCEYIYYTSLSIDKSRSIFVHVPPLDQPYSAQQLAEGLAAIVRCLVQQLRDRQLDQAATS